MADELFALKTNFYIGAHQAVISEALTVSPSTDAVRIERDFFMYRAYVDGETVSASEMTAWCAPM